MLTIINMNPSAQPAPGPLPKLTEGTLNVCKQTKGRGNIR